MAETSWVILSLDIRTFENCDYAHANMKKTDQIVE